MKPLAALLCGALLVASPAAAAPSSPSTLAGPRLGVVAVELTPELRTHFTRTPDRGVLVGRVMPGSAAAKAGLRVGDLIVLIDGKPVDEADDIRRALRGKVEGAGAELVIVRDGKEMTVEAELGGSEPAARFLERFPFDGWLDRGWFAPGPRA